MSDFLETLDVHPFKEKLEDSSFDAQKASAERYKALLLKAHPAPEGCSLRIFSNSHDLGTYVSIDAYGNNDDDTHWEWVNSLSEEETWDQLEK